MVQTNNLKFNLVAQSQSQKEVTINEGLARLDALLNHGVADKDLSTPPGAPLEGAAYIVNTAATGAWLGKEGQIAYYNSGWKFIIPNEGLVTWVNDEDKVYIYNGTTWISYTDNFNLTKLGVNTTPDTTNKFAVASDAVLLTTATGNMQLKINKTAAANSGTVLYQDGFSGRAEVGLAGDDNLKLKVSSDGSTWNNGIVITAATGVVDNPSGMTIGSGTVVKKVVSGVANLNFSNILPGTSLDLTIPVPGATLGSSVELGLAALPVLGLVHIGFVTAVDTVTVRCFNISSAAINPAGQDIRATVSVF